MKEEKIKEIKKALECCKQNEIENTCEYCSKCPASDWDYETECNVELFQKALTLINELESENERIKRSKNIAEYRFEHRIDRLEHQIAEMQKENEILQGTKDRLTFADRVAIGNKALNEVKLVLLPKFAERLKAKMPCKEVFKGIWDKIDETLKEFLK